MRDGWTQSQPLKLAAGRRASLARVFSVLGRTGRGDQRGIQAVPARSNRLLVRRMSLITRSWRLVRHPAQVNTAPVRMA